MLYNLYAKFKVLMEATEHEEASDYSTPPNRLIELSKHSDPNVVAAVAENPATPQAILQELLHPSKDTGPVDYSKNQHIKQAIARNPSTPSEILKELAKNKYHEHVLQNLALPLIMLEDPGFLNSDIDAMKNFASSPNLPPDLQKNIYATASAMPGENTDKSEILGKLFPNIQDLNTYTRPEDVELMKKIQDYNKDKIDRDEGPNAVALSHFDHILTMHPDKEVRDTALVNVKNAADASMEHLYHNSQTAGMKTTDKMWHDLFYPVSRNEAAENTLKTLLNSPNHYLRSYTRMHPIVQKSLNRVHDSEQDVDPRYGLDINGEPYELPEPEESLMPPKDRMKIKTGRVKYDTRTDDTADETIDIDQHKSIYSTNTGAAEGHWNNPKVYHFLSQSKDPDVRKLISKNEYAPSLALHSLANDSDPEVRMNVTKHPNVTHHTLNMMRLDKDPEIRNSAIKAYNEKKFNKQVRNDKNKTH